jgi:hypothetical protein
MHKTAASGWRAEQAMKGKPVERIVLCDAPLLHAAHETHKYCCILLMRLASSLGIN